MNQRFGLATLLLFALPVLVFAQQERSSLPIPDPEFKGKIGRTYEDSTPDFPLPVKAPKGSPNVLIMLLDDVGFGMCSTFGGPVPTPNMQKLANNGLSYTRFHTTALCSPTRGALLAGRNHHSIATGVIIEMGTGYPGYTGVIPKSTALVPQVLRDNGYATSMFGNPNTPVTHEYKAPFAFTGQLDKVTIKLE
ncbi:MAG: sulfatase-like hydrolase/transferase [Planctomycetales bacterium]|nr:sulfatase-like hydrolase/transferase [Planctomycetales bacterium]